MCICREERERDELSLYSSKTRCQRADTRPDLEGVRRVLKEMRELPVACDDVTKQLQVRSTVYREPVRDPKLSWADSE